MAPMDLHELLDQSKPGFLNLGGARMALLDLQSGFWAIHRQMTALVGNRLTRSVFQQAGANGGASFAGSFIPTINQTGPDAFKTCLQIYQTAGFGQFEITSIEWPIGHVEIRANQAFEAWMQTQNEPPISDSCCAYTAGVLVGFVNVIAGRKDVVCIEQKCQGKGDEVCLFSLIPASEAIDQEVVALSPDPGLGHQINLMEMLFERMPMGIAVLDRQYRIQRYNPTWEDFAQRYGPQSSPPMAPGIGYFEHLKGSEPVVSTIVRANTVWVKPSEKMVSALKSMEL